MEGYLTQNQIDYVFYHLNLVAKLDDKITDAFVFSTNDLSVNARGKIVFRLSNRPIEQNDIKNIEQIPILFPLNNDTDRFYAIENDNLIFNHDILKSCFYLLSGYQEIVSDERDTLGRFPYGASIQHKLGIVSKPIVNYYFEIIINAINAFYNHDDALVQKRKLFSNFGFMLTHDIDYIDYFTFGKFLYKIKEIVGISKTYYSGFSNIKQLFRIMFELLKFRFKKNPSWTFNYIRHIEKLYAFRSVFYFLPKAEKNKDSKYRFSEPRIQQLFEMLKYEKCEIGLHGTVKSCIDREAAHNIKNDLELNSGKSIVGIRQHRLLYQLPKTTLIHEKIGLKYDSTLCFAEHEGFRNGFCLPFKPYDFKNDRMIDVWEIPLNIMDVTIFHYRKLNTQNAMNEINNVINEIIKFNGVLTLLWHNDFFDNERYPGITQFYEELHYKIANDKPENMLGSEIIERLNTL